MEKNHNRTQENADRQKPWSALKSIGSAAVRKVVDLPVFSRSKVDSHVAEPELTQDRTSEGMEVDAQDVQYPDSLTLEDLEKILRESREILDRVNSESGGEELTPAEKDFYARMQSNMNYLQLVYAEYRYREDRRQLAAYREAGYYVL